MSSVAATTGYRVGDHLLHLSDGSHWEVVEFRGGRHGDHRCKCVAEGRGSALGRVDDFHLEYMLRSFSIIDGPDRRRVVVKTIDAETDEVLGEKPLGPEGDYIVVTGPGFFVAHQQYYPGTDTTQLTIKRRPPEGSE